MEILIDTREKEAAIKNIVSTFDSKNVNYDRSKLYIGDYMSLDNARRVVDRKQNLSELYTNMCHEGKKGKIPESTQRFRKELERSNEMKVCIIFLIEHGKDIKTIEDVKNWYNPQLDKTPYAWNGEYMYHQMKLLLKQYPLIRFKFCDKKETGQRIIELLQQEASRKYEVLQR